MSEKFLKVEDLVVEYRTGGKVVHAVNNVSFELERGKTLGLVGETGAGKTTIAKTILRVLPDAQAKVKSGKVILDGVDLLSLSEAAMRKVRGGQVTMVFQDPMTALNPIMKVGEQIAEVIRKHQTREDKTAREMAEDMLAMVGIPRERYGEYPHQFSGGMKQRVLLLQALLNDPKFLILDEPTAGLDPKERIRIRNLISDLSEDRIVLIATHVVSDIEFISKEILLMKNGRLVDQDSPENLQKRIYGHVYELCISQDELAEVKKEYEISNLFRRDGEIIVRVIADKCPVKYDAVKVSPTLEDVYLYEFEGVKRR
mgnify:CR=1 FL=1